MAKTRPYILIAGIILLYAAAVQLNSFFKNSFLEKGNGPDIIQNIFGGMRSFAGDWAFMKAEEYHHRGLPFMGTLAYHHGESTLMAEVRGGNMEEHHHAEEEQKNDIFSRIYRAVKVTEDSHLVPSEEKEVLPWFYSEVLLNPHDIRGYVLGGYWLERIGRYDESLKFLKEGDRNNPDSAQILTLIGKIYFHDKKIEEAIVYLEHARELWLKGGGLNVVTNQYMESDRIITFDLLGYLYENEGQHEKALEVYGELSKFWKSPALEEKIIKLKNMIKAVK
jgi:tetratricopeptide (TPR) repeat protein